MARKPQQGSRDEEEQLAARVQRDAERRLKAREARHRTAWFGLGMFGLVGWSVAIPTLGGIALGLWLDARWPGRPSWTLTFMLIGVGLGCLNAWYWVRQESRRD